MTRAKLGDRQACATCGLDIEYHGKAHGWIDRGGNTRCDQGGGAKWDGDGVPVEMPHRKHAPPVFR